MRAGVLKEVLFERVERGDSFFARSPLAVYSFRIVCVDASVLGDVFWRDHSFFFAFGKLAMAAARSVARE